MGGLTSKLPISTIINKDNINAQTLLHNSYFNPIRTIKLLFLLEFPPLSNETLCWENSQLSNTTHNGIISFFSLCANAMAGVPNKLAKHNFNINKKFRQSRY